MKTTEQVLTDIERRLANTWASCAAETVRVTPHIAMAAEDIVLSKPRLPSDQQGRLSTSWPHAFPLGQPSSTNLTRDFASAASWAATWRTWSATHSASLRTRIRRVHNTDQELPTHLVVSDVDHAARLCGRSWPQRLERGRRRADRFADRFPHLIEAGLLAATVAAVDELSEVDFELLCRAGAWFAEHDAAGLTPRQVPIEGLHAKWLNYQAWTGAPSVSPRRPGAPATTPATSALYLP